MSEPEPRDLAHEADMERLRREQLRADISPEEAAEECEGWDDDWIDEEHYECQWCSCSVNHSIEELDTNQCDCCGREIE